MKFLCFHGMNTDESDSAWKEAWEGSIRRNLKIDASTDPEFKFVPHNEVITSAQAGPLEVAKASKKLITSWNRHRYFMYPGAQTRGFADLNIEFIVKWLALNELRVELRGLVKESIQDFKPNWLIAHSFGSLITYDYLSESADAELSQLQFVTLGSQISHPALREAFGGRLTMPKGISRWINLHNPLDRVFVSPIEIYDAPGYFEEILTAFDTPNSAWPGGFINHDFDRYLSHPNTVQRLWAQPDAQTGRVRATLSPSDLRVGEEPLQMNALVESPKRAEKENKVVNKALLIGINEYKNPKLELAGCRNDVFTISSVLQEVGIQPDEIRVVFDDRATAAGIRERLTWLLGDPQPNDTRILYFSGHGAQLPIYNSDSEFDGFLECLVPHDFDGSEQSGITDVFLKELYSQLPYDTNLIIILDCCHSGGATRSAGRVRGIQISDDIMHRALKWNKKLGMWERRTHTVLDAGTAESRSRSERLAGADLQTYRIGTAVEIRDQNLELFDELRTRKGHLGPYMPLVIAACKENQFAYEYSHGAIAYGAFTFAFAQQLRNQNISRFDSIPEVVGSVLKQIGFGDQDPEITGPESKRKQRVPILGERGQSRKRPAPKPTP